MEVFERVEREYEIVLKDKEAKIKLLEDKLMKFEGKIETEIA
jgi:hypothetical protein